MNLLAIFIGGGIGSICRYAISMLVLKLVSTHFPLGTFIANILSCVIVAFAVIYFNEKASENMVLKLFIITGFCGGFSTFSTFSMETMELFKNGSYLFAGLNILVSVLMGVSILFFVLKDQ